MSNLEPAFSAVHKRHGLIAYVKEKTKGLGCNRALRQITWSYQATLYLVYRLQHVSPLGLTFQCQVWTWLLGRSG